jgi:phosphoribosylamine--glycine ligase
VIAASGGYPGEYESNVPIHGLEKVETGDELQVFHGGTKRRGADVVTAGGRVLGVCALGESVAAASAKAYAALRCIEFKGMHARRDIGIASHA